MMIDALTYVGASPEERAAFAQVVRIPRFEFFDAVDSTQDVARMLAEEGAPSWTVVAANYQSQGRGQHGRTWKGGQESSLMFSVLLRTDRADWAGLLPIRVGMAAARAIDRHIAHRRVALKWPNDLVLDGGKVGGVLCEAQTRSGEIQVVTGVGVNVAPFTLRLEDGRDLAPAFLQPFLLPSATRLDLLASIINELRTMEQRPPTLGDEELYEYASRDWLAGQMLSAPAEGIARGIDRRGALLVETTPGRIETMIAGRVQLAWRS